MEEEDGVGFRTGRREVETCIGESRRNTPSDNFVGSWRADNGECGGTDAPGPKMAQAGPKLAPARGRQGPSGQWPASSSASTTPAQAALPEPRMGKQASWSWPIIGGCSPGDGMLSQTLFYFAGSHPALVDERRVVFSQPSYL